MLFKRTLIITLIIAPLVACAVALAVAGSTLALVADELSGRV